MGKVYSILVKIGASIKDFEKKIATVQKKIERTGKNISKVGEKMTKGFTVPIVAGATALAMLVTKSVSASEELVRLSDVTGLSVEELQRMKYVGSQLGVSLDTITSAQTKLTRSIASAIDGNKEAIQSFEQLGISLYDANGQLKEAPAIFNEVIDKLGAIEDPVLRDALAMELMGKSAMDLNPLIKAGSDEIERLKQRAQELGLVLSEEDVKALEKFGDSMDTAKTQIEVAGSKIAIAFLPILDRMMEIFNELAPKIEKVVTQLAEGFAKLPKPVQDFIAILLIVLATLGPLLLMVGLITMAFSPWMLILIAIIAVLALLWFNWENIMKWMGNAFKKMGEVVGAVWNTIVDGVEAGINHIIGMINLLIKGINLIPGVKFPLIPKVDFNGNGKDLFGTLTSEKNQTTNVNVVLDGRKISSYTDYQIGGRSVAQGGAY